METSVNHKCKAFTSLEQSRKLAEILPHESADMFFIYDYFIGDFGGIDFISPGVLENNDVPCWSLTALLNYLREIDFFPEIDADECEVTMNIKLLSLAAIHNIKVKAESFIDACVEMIINLHEQKKSLMIMNNYEQKYKKALEAVKFLQEVNPSDEGIQNWVKDNFPELKESEDERIRKEIIEQVAYIIPNDDEVDSEGDALSTYQKRINKYRAWLEKQGHMLDPDKVIEWIDEHVPTKFEDVANYVQQFKEDFGL